MSSYAVKTMGRPREHNEATREALRSAAERLFDKHGAEGVSVRALADAVGTTTRAVYSLFGSRDGLLVDAMGVRAYELLNSGMDDHAETDDPADDLVEMGVSVFRRLVVDHPTLFRITFQRVLADFQPGPELLAVRESSLGKLTKKVGRLQEAGLLGSMPLSDAVVAFQATCEGLGNFELRGAIMRLLPAEHADEAWRGVLSVMIRGLTTS
jgi:AcrR family transcriptional regulator